MSKLHSLIQKELNQLTSNHNYYGSENQIKNEIYISKNSPEMLYNETIEEYYKRLLK
tara:strand:+ start:241 stop:411 length:171 start_codon:yes stop_codon:yes gene_type:complete